MTLNDLVVLGIVDDSDFVTPQKVASSAAIVIDDDTFDVRVALSRITYLRNIKYLHSDSRNGGLSLTDEGRTAFKAGCHKARELLDWMRGY